MQNGIAFQTTPSEESNLAPPACRAARFVRLCSADRLAGSALASEGFLAPQSVGNQLRETTYDDYEERDGSVYLHDKHVRPRLIASPPTSPLESF